MKPGHQEILRIIHISDLHITDDLDPESKDPRYETSCFPWPLLDGWMGHSSIALRALEATYWDFVAETRESQTNEVMVVFTGDLTAYGKREQLHLGSAFFEGQMERPHGEQLGLELADWRESAIPGNHDYWPSTSRPWFSPVDDRVLEHFEVMPYLRDQDIGHGFHLRLVALESDCDVWTNRAVERKTYNRFFARGCFSSQIGEARRVLEETCRQEDKVVNVLLIHHSRNFVDPYNVCGVGCGMHEITERSRPPFDKLVHHGHIGIVLSGHVHELEIQPVPAPNAGDASACLEIRCGSTTKHPGIPPWFRQSRLDFEFADIERKDPGLWRGLGRAAEKVAQRWWKEKLAAKHENNWLYVHKLLLDTEGRLHWEAVPYQLLGGEFREQRHTRHYKMRQVWPCMPIAAA